MKRERESDDESDDQGGISKSRTSTEEYGMYNPGYSFVRPSVVQTKPATKRTRVGDRNATTANNVPVKSEPELESSRELSIKVNPDADLYGLETGVGPSRHNNLPDVQTPRHNNSNSPVVQTQPLAQHPRENENFGPDVTEDTPREDEDPILITIKEKLHKAILNLTLDEPTPPRENLPPWGKHFALSGPCPKMVNPALTIYGLGGIGLPLSQRDAGFIANFTPPVPDPDTKVSNAAVDLTMSKITELSPYQLETTNPEWEKAVGGVVAKVAKKLKVPGGPANVGFLPCNMTLYRTGDMFKEHRESKKGKGVFGTLAICLPSKHEGGDLIVKHDDQAKVLSTELQSAFGYSYIFWYANLITELTEVSEGNRLVLMYDLIKVDSDGSENVPDAPTSFWQKMDQLESAFQFWKSNYSEQASSCPKFLAYTLDNMYDEHKLSRVILQGDDYQRVNGLLQLCKRHGFIIYLAKLRLRVGRERGGQIKELLEVQQVVQLDGTKVFELAPLDSSAIVQDNIFSDALNNRDNLGYIGSDRANNDQVHHRFAAMLMPAESYIDFYFRSAKSSAAAMNNWIVQLTTVCLSPDANEFSKIDLERACQLVIKDARQWWDEGNAPFDNSQKSPSTMDILLGTVIRGGIYLDDPKICAECLSLVRFDIPMLAAVDAIKSFGLGKLQCDVAISHFRAINKELEALMNIYQPFQGIGHSAMRADLITWIKPHAEKMFASKHIMFAEDGDSVAQLGVICGEAYLKETIVPAIRSEIQTAKKLLRGKSAAVLGFLTNIFSSHRSGLVGVKTVQHVFDFVLQTFIPRLKVIIFQSEREYETMRNPNPIQIRPNHIIQLLGQCVSLGLRHYMVLIFDKLDKLSRIGDPEVSFDGFFLPLLTELDGMPPGQTPGNITQEFHAMAHQFADKLRKLHAVRFSSPQHMGPQPRHMNSESQGVSIQPQQPSPMDLPEEELDCTCKDCLKFAAFIEDSAAKSVKFSFSTEARIAHYKTYQLHQITKRGFRHRCTITPMENSGVEKYSVTITRSRTQFAKGTRKGECSQDKTETPKTSASKATASAARYNLIAPITKASAPKTRTSTLIRTKRVTKYHNFDHRG